MPVRAFAAGWRVMKSGQVYFEGAWRAVGNIRRYTDGQWVVVYARPVQGSMTAQVVPDQASGFTRADFADTVETGSVTARPIGGSPPFKYAWTVNIGAPTQPTQATTAFTNVTSPRVTLLATAIVTVTDANGLTAQATCSVSYENRGRDSERLLNGGNNGF